MDGGLYIFVVGAVGIVGSLDSGLRGDHTVLFTKSLIDGRLVISLTSTFGIGIMFSALSIFIFQATITILAAQIDCFISSDLMDQMIGEITGTGGIMIIALGIRMIRILNIRVANLLPTILFTVILVAALYYWDSAFQSIIQIF